MKFVLLSFLLGFVFMVQVDAKKHYKKVETQETSEENGSSFKRVSSCFSSQVVINNAYNNISGHLIPDAERAKIKAKMLKESEIVYGEIKHEAVAILLKELKLTDQDVVYDLGSGVGKFCMQVALDSPAKKVVGVELCPTRHMNAQKAVTMVEDDVKVNIEERLFFKEEDFLKTDIADATVVFLCSTCYSSELMMALTKKLVQCKKGLRVLALNPLPEYKKKDKEFVLIKTVSNVPMSWDTQSAVYLYELRETEKRSADDAKSKRLKHKKDKKLKHEKR